MSSADLADALYGCGTVSGSQEPDKWARFGLGRAPATRIDTPLVAEALASLDASTAGAFAPLVQEVRGDAYAAKGDAAAALKEYVAALEAAGQDSGLDREFVELKRDAQAPVPPATAPAPATASAPVAPEAHSPEAVTK